jgi:hypothetical protein
MVVRGDPFFGFRALGFMALEENAPVADAQGSYQLSAIS